MLADSRQRHFSIFAHISFTWPFEVWRFFSQDFLQKQTRQLKNVFFHVTFRTPLACTLYLEALKIIHKKDWKQGTERRDSERKGEETERKSSETSAVPAFLTFKCLRHFLNFLFNHVSSPFPAQISIWCVNEYGKDRQQRIVRENGSKKAEEDSDLPVEAALWLQ